MTQLWVIKHFRNIWYVSHFAQLLSNTSCFFPVCSLVQVWFDRKTFGMKALKVFLNVNLSPLKPVTSEFRGQGVFAPAPRERPTPPALRPPASPEHLGALQSREYRKKHTNPPQIAQMPGLLCEARKLKSWTWTLLSTIPLPASITRFHTLH